MSKDCLFCKIIGKKIPAKIAYEDKEVVAFHDVNPQAPTHILFVPKKHIETVADVSEKDPVVSVLSARAVQLAKQLEIAKEGFRLVINCGSGGGQTVFHLHLHLLGGRFMTWPPG